jgi:hypothetical protein
VWIAPVTAQVMMTLLMRRTLFELIYKLINCHFEQW